MMNTIKELEAYFETELRYTKAGLDKETDPKRRNEISWYCVQRCLGAAQFANQLGGDFSIIEPMFEYVKERVMKIANGA